MSTMVTERLTARSKQRALNSLGCLVMGLVGQKLTVELHNDIFVHGVLTRADPYMNIEMSDAVYTDGNGKKVHCQNFLINGRKIRYVHIPETVDPMQVIKNKIDELSGPRPGQEARRKTALIKQKIIAGRDQRTLKKLQGGPSK